MKLGVINAASKTALTVLRSYLAKTGSRFEQVYLFDLFPSYSAFQTVFSFLENEKDLDKFHIEMMHQKYYMKKITDQCDALVFFTHNHYLNVTCKNQNLKNFSEILDPSSQQTVDIVSLAEKCQTIEGDSFFANALNTEKEFGDVHKTAKFYWTDFIYGGPTEFQDFIKAKKSLPRTGKTYNFVHADKVVDSIANARNNNSASQFHLIAPNTQKTDAELASKGWSYGLYLKENLLSQNLTDVADRQNYRLWANPPDLNKHFKSYQNIGSNAKYEDLSIKDNKADAKSSFA